MGGEMSCVFRRNWMDVAQTIDDLTLRCQFYEAVIQYALNGMETDAPPELKLALKLIYGLIDADREKYQKVCERRREAGRKGGAPKGNQNACKDAETSKNNQNETKQDNTNTNTITNTNTNTDTNTNESKDSNLNLNPLPPKGGNGWAKSFEDLCNRISKVTIPKAIKDAEYELQYVWRMSEGNPGYGTSISRALRDCSSLDEVRSRVQTINKKYPPHSDFQAAKLAWMLQGAKPNVLEAVINELNRSGGETGIFSTIIEKVEYINSGAKVINLGAFMKSRNNK